MNISEILSLDHTECCVSGVSKKRVLEHISHLIADTMSDIDADQLYLQFVAREKLGSTGIGEGIAVPHCRLAGCTKITGALLKLDDQVDFDSIDNQPVDLVFALVVPEEENDEHLKTLAAIAGLMQHEQNRIRLRQATTSESLFHEAVSAQAA